MEIGTVKWFKEDKGYGFITRQSGEDIFVDKGSINMGGFTLLREGERVEFDVVNGPKGLQAKNVRRV